MNKCILTVALLVAISPVLLAQEKEQENDITAGLIDPNAKVERFSSEGWTHDPKKAIFYSILFPGLGQIYNGSYWKLPIIYGGMAFVVYNATFNHTQLQNFRNAIFAAEDGDPNTINPYDGLLSLEQLGRRVENFRRQREYSIIFGLGLYALNFIDALVEAHLKEFDISDDLGLQVKPVFSQNTYAGLHAGIGVSFKIKY